MLGSVLTDRRTLLTTLIMVDKLNDMLSPIMHFMCMYCRSCSGGSHLPFPGDSAKTVLQHDIMNVWELCLPRAQMLLPLIMLVIVLLSYLCTQETQCRE
jgi:hypothetical protein